MTLSDSFGVNHRCVGASEMLSTTTSFIHDKGGFNYGRGLVRGLGIWGQASLWVQLLLPGYAQIIFTRYHLVTEETKSFMNMPSKATYSVCSALLSTTQYVTSWSLSSTATYSMWWRNLTSSTRLTRFLTWVWQEHTHETDLLTRKRTRKQPCFSIFSCVKIFGWAGAVDWEGNFPIILC